LATQTEKQGPQLALGVFYFFLMEFLQYFQYWVRLLFPLARLGSPSVSLSDPLAIRATCWGICMGCHHI
jgi:hypothetical protein